MGGVYRGDERLMKTIKTCPFGSICEEPKDGAIYRCRLFLEMARFDEAGQQIPGSEYSECAFTLQSIHLTELKKGTRGVQKAVESRLNSLLGLATQAKRLNAQ